MKIITVSARKGGVGKTTLTYLISTYLAKKLNKKVLLIDADPQANLSSMFFDDPQNHLSQIFLSKNFDIATCIEKTNFKNLDIICSNLELDEINNLILNETIRQKVFAKKIAPNWNDLKKQYDYILIDTNPSLSLINQNMLLISDEIILISDKGKYSARGVFNLINDWQLICDDFEIKNQMKHIILNRLENKLASKQIIEFMKNQFKDKVLETHLNEYALIQNAINRNESLTNSKRLRNLGDPIKNIVNELIARKVL